VRRRPVRPACDGLHAADERAERNRGGRHENGAVRARNHIAGPNGGQIQDYCCRGKNNAFSRKKFIVTRSSVSRPASSGVPVRTTAQRILRSLNVMGVVVADSVPAVREVEPTDSPAVLGGRR
jgi:hypothetical protein